MFVGMEYLMSSRLQVATGSAWLSCCCIRWFGVVVVIACFCRFREFKDVVFEDVVFDNSRLDTDVTLTNNI